LPLRGCHHDAERRLRIALPPGRHLRSGEERSRNRNDHTDIRGWARKQGISIREDAGGGNFTVVNGIDVPSYRVMKPWMAFKKGPGYDGDRWFASAAPDEVVLGFEAAEYEQRKVRDTFYTSIAPAGQPEAVMHEFKVVGVLDRTGTQDDGSVFLPIDVARRYFGRPDQLTLLGIKLNQFNALKMREFETRWLKLPGVQVVGLQQVKKTLVSLVATAQTMIAAVAAIAVIVALIGDHQHHTHERL
jgi:putative ABC transport system permease protein